MGKVGHPSPFALRVVHRLIRPVVRLAFRPTIEGLEHLPIDRPYLLVANHSAGLGLAEVLSFITVYVGAFGGARPLAGFAHPVGFKVPLGARLHGHLGSIPSTYEAAYAALADGVPILVFPGGDHETLRPIWQANRVDFGGRKGFARIAISAQVPVIPMGITGSHLTAPMLWRARSLAWVLGVPRLFGIKRWGVSLLGVMGVALIALSSWACWVKVLTAWLWLATPLMLLPWVPWTIRFRIGPALPLFDPQADPADARDAVQAAVQALVGARASES